MDASIQRMSFVEVVAGKRKTHVREGRCYVGSGDPLSQGYQMGLGEGDSSAAATGALTTRTTATGRDVHRSH